MPFVIPRDFFKPAAVCRQTDSLEVVLNRFQREQLNELVVLNERRSPVGIIFVRSLLAYWFGDRATAEILRTPIGELTEAIASPQTDAVSPLLQPLTSLPCKDGLQALETICRQSPPPWAAVDERGQFLGLVDAGQFWKWFADQQRTEVEPFVRLDTQTRTAGGEAWTVDIADAPSVPSSLLWETFSLLSSVEILRRLPLPLMLQTGSGQIVVQNSAWQQRLSELQNPVEVWQAAAPLLEQVPVMSGDRNGICQMGTDVNSCDCVCTLKDGGERVWRFVKIPFGLLTMGASDVTAVVQPVADSYINMDRVLHSWLTDKSCLAST